ncbi:MAG: AAA family ATPase [Myxococcota bacterium]
MCQPKALERLKSEYELGRMLDTRAVVKPLALDAYQGMPTLVMEDFGGQSLDQFLGAAMDVELFLRLAVEIASAVAEIHQHDVIHRDIKPQNIVVNLATGEVKITDLGSASRLPRDRQLLPSPEQMEGSPPYIAPELTGRLNRPVDTRADLYALGVTFYQMLTGQLPFEARDTLEWIHCHVARTPRPPRELVPAIPETVATIVLTLLAKEPGDRYQTARGLRHDLQECLEQWHAEGTVRPFPLRERDVSDRLQVPSRLFGRDEELGLLHRTFQRVLASEAPELVALSGYAGVGKSALALALRKAVLDEHAHFVTGKFDPYAQRAPYSAIVRAFAEKVGELLGEDEAPLREWRGAFQAALGINGKLIVDVIPPLRLIIGEQPPVAELPPLEAEVRFRRIFRGFVDVFCRHGRALVLFLDDLQWSDAASLCLLEDIVTGEGTHGVLLIGAFRDNEVTPAHPVARTLDRLRHAGAQVTEVVLTPLRRDDVVRLVAETVRASPDVTRPLGSLVYDKTAGNPFFVIQFLGTLRQEGLLQFNESRAAWQWDVARIEEQGYTDNVVDFMVQKLGRLPPDTQEALRSAACVGGKGQLQTLALVRGTSEEQAREDLWDALREGLLYTSRDWYSFAHDRIHQAAYLMLPQPARDELHLRIGRLFLTHTPPEELQERVYEVVNQLNLGAALITDPDERRSVAHLDLTAGRKAKAAAAYKDASDFIAAGIAVLPPHAWEESYELAYALHLELAECAYVNRHFDDAEGILRKLLACSRTRLDKARAYRVKINLHTIKGESDAAVASAIECLRLFGIELPLHPDEATLRQAYLRTRGIVGARRVEELVDLPRMEDPEMRAAMDILSVMNAAGFVDANLLHLRPCHMVELSLRHGNADASAVGYVEFGMGLSLVLGECEEGRRFGELGCALVDRFDLLTYKAQVYDRFGNFVNYWTRHLRSNLPYLRAAFDAATLTGNLTWTCYTSADILVVLLLQGDPLADVHRECEQRLEVVSRTGYHDLHLLIRALERFVAAMRGHTAHFATFDDAGFREAEFEERIRALLPTAECWYQVLKLQAHFLAGDVSAALHAARRAEELLWSATGMLIVTEHCFYSALAMAAAAGEGSAGERLRYEENIARRARLLQRWARSCPQNFAAKHALVRAEMARLEERDLDAMRLYEEAIRAAHESGFIQVEGLAYELASSFYRARGYALIADVYVGEARACYARWGADGKVRQIDHRYPRLVEPRAAAAITTITVRPEQFDLRSVIKASQTISGEIVLEKLVRTLLQVVLQHGGARKGYLLLAGEGGLSIQAGATLEDEGGEMQILQALPAAASTLVPMSIVNYVARVGERVILEDARAGGRFSADPYVEQHKPRSVLCLPIVRQAEVVGLLYLENNLMAGAFTSARVGVLDLLASQAAISLQNALLLSREKGARRAAEAAEQRAAFLAQASRVLTESLDDKQVLHRLAQLTVRELADWCVIDIVLPDGTRQRAAGAHVDPAREPLLRELQRRYPPGPDSPQPAARVLSTGEPVLMPELPDAVLRETCIDDDHFRLIRALGTRTALAVPLVARGRTLGVMSMGSEAPGRRYGRAEVELAQDVAYRAAIAIDNAQLYVRVQEAVRQRDEFLSVAAHELYTPMTSLKLSLDALQRASSGAPPLPEATAKLLDMIRRQGDRLSRLIGEMLNVARIETGRLPLERTQVELGALAHEVGDRFRADLARAGCSLLIRADAPVVGAWDRSRIDQVITNLLANAMKFGARKPIEISVEEKGGCARLAVRDQGFGIAPEMRERIFQRFVRGVPTRHYGGLGLGLYICRGIVEAHRGTIRVESEPGEGATFIVELPCVPPAPAAGEGPSRQPTRA